ncbi:MAG TPA: hypothetical protein VGS57_23390 [Thermoanaerobaculia bacterium]|jgi:hypothetical protein|nr:hypothetical protein [Thermoanaerobaculia bacterium]
MTTKHRAKKSEAQRREAIHLARTRGGVGALVLTSIQVLMLVVGIEPNVLLAIPLGVFTAALASYWVWVEVKHRFPGRWTRWIAASLTAVILMGFTAAASVHLQRQRATTRTGAPETIPAQLAREIAKQFPRSPGQAPAIRAELKRCGDYECAELWNDGGPVETLNVEQVSFLQVTRSASLTTSQETRYLPIYYFMDRQTNTGSDRPDLHIDFRAQRRERRLGD